MVLKEKIRSALRESYGTFNSNLEHEYEDKVTEVLIKGSTNNRKEWATYNQVILELKHNIKDNLRVRELLYRLTNREDPNNACIEVIKEITGRSAELDRLYHKIINFL
jgi:two-component sensor histidine kinase